jgi:juvenile hormone-III synthase
MDNAELYNTANDFQKLVVRDTLEEFRSIFERKSGGHVSLLDVGCGSGNVLVDLIIPRLPQKNVTVIGADISKQMLKYAMENYSNEHLRYVEVDIESNFLTDGSQSCLVAENFDFVTSFNTIHWIQDQR